MLFLLLLLLALLPYRGRSTLSLWLLSSRRISHLLLVMDKLSLAP